MSSSLWNSGFSGTRYWPGSNHRPDKPLIVVNMLTNEIWEYDSVSELYGPNLTFFDWAGGPFRPGVYNVINNTATPLNVILFGQSYSVLPGQVWEFSAHDEIGAHAAPGTSAGSWFNPNESRQLGSYWDTLLGGSIWDGGQSQWDLINA